MTTDFRRIEDNPAYKGYTYRGQPWQAVDDLLAKLEPIIDRQTGLKKQAQAQGVAPDILQAELEASRIASQEISRLTHLHIADRLQGKPSRFDKQGGGLRLLPQMKAFDRYWAAASPVLRPFQSNWLIGDQRLRIAGRLDALVKASAKNTYHLLAFKVQSHFSLINPLHCLQPPFADLGASDHNRASLALSLYRLILERNCPQLPFGDCFLIHLDDQGQFSSYPAIDFRERLLAWREDLN